MEDEQTITIKDSAIVLALWALEKAAIHAGEAMQAIGEAGPDMEDDVLGEAGARATAAYITSRAAQRIINGVFKDAGADVEREVSSAAADECMDKYEETCRVVAFEFETVLEEDAGVNKDRPRQ